MLKFVSTAALGAMLSLWVAPAFAQSTTTPAENGCLPGETYDAVLKQCTVEKK